MNRNGSLRRIEHRGLMVNLFPGTLVEGGPANIYLRIHGPEVVVVPLLGPGGASRFGFEDGFSASGEAGGLFYQLELTLAADEAAWFWKIRLENRSAAPVKGDLILVQDVGIADYGAIRRNEYLVSRHIDHEPLAHPRHGVVIASRQNQPMGGRHPWLLTGSLHRGMAFATDALQIFGRDHRPGSIPMAIRSGLPGTRLQHEHSMVAIQDEAFDLAPGEVCGRGFFGRIDPDKPGATCEADAAVIDRLVSLPAAEVSGITLPGVKPGTSLFSTAPWLDGDEVDRETLVSWFGGPVRDLETDSDGRPLSFFFGGNRHVATRLKERAVLRPHGHILRSGSALVPDEGGLTSTCWMDGVFHSMATQGHVGINRFLSTCHGYLGLFRSHGLRIFLKCGDGWRQLGCPSAFELSPSGCRWIYQTDGGVFEVVSEAPPDRHVLRLTFAVRSGEAVDVLFTMHTSLHGDDGIASVPLRWEPDGSGVLIRPAPDGDVGGRFPDGGFRVLPAGDSTPVRFGDDAGLFDDGVSRDQPFLTAESHATVRAGLEIEGRLIKSRVQGDAEFWEDVAGGLSISSEGNPAAGRLATIYPWWVQNALVHYLSPRGLEQDSGGGWGTRDVCQGAFEFLMAQARFHAARDLLCRVFRQQNSDGDWPQWFMFFERERNIRPGDSHGDIVFWPLLALARYLLATRDHSILVEEIPFHHPDGADAAEIATMREHVERAVDLILERVVPGTSLAAYGNGDGNDALQPARSGLRERLCSSWTVTLNYQTFVALSRAFRMLGFHERARTLETMAANILDEFQRRLVIDEVVAGLVHFPAEGPAEPWLHPKDRSTGLSYSLLPMTHAVIHDMFTPRQAEKHLELIREKLAGPDGAHLFDRPLAYHGGVRTRFQRAESASCFGREIGIMDTHAHLRYCEALARYGDAEGFFDALCRSNPVAIRELVPSAALRQSNCFHSSSDPAFADRYEACEHYGRVGRGEVELEGGWRVCSSGAGIGVRLILQCFLGLRVEKSHWVIDPVVPPALDGMVARLRLGGRAVEVLYQVGGRGCGPVSVNLNGEDLDFVREANPYRTAGVRIARDAFDEGLTGKDDRLTLWIG